MFLQAAFSERDRVLLAASGGRATHRFIGGKCVFFPCPQVSDFDLFSRFSGWPVFVARRVLIDRKYARHDT